MELQIRQVRESDAAALSLIYGHYVRETAVTFDEREFGTSWFLEKIRKVQQFYPFFVAQSGDTIVGYAYAGPFVGRDAYRWSAELTIYLHPDWIHKEIGTSLYRKLEDALELMGIRTAYACIAVPDEEDAILTDASRRFHLHNGFQAVGFFSRCAYQFGRWYHMAWMGKRIGDWERPMEEVRPYASVSALQFPEK